MESFRVLQVNVVGDDICEDLIRFEDPYGSQEAHLVVVDFVKVRVLVVQVEGLAAVGSEIHRDVDLSSIGGSLLGVTTS